MTLRAFLYPLIAVVLGCSGDKRPTPETLVVPDACDGRTEGIVCEQGVAFTCENGDVLSQEDCGAQALKCDTGRGCSACRPLSYECDGNALMLCSEDGRSRVFQHECAAGTLCSASGCADLCAEAESLRSYIGCEYWPVFTLNSELDPVFRPAVVIGNPQLVPIQVKLTLGAQIIAEAEVAPGATHTIEIPALKHEPLRSTASHSVLARQAAYRLVSNGPITVHQFNPLYFKVEQRCKKTQDPPEDPDAGVPKKCHSFSNDASLLLPSHVLKREAGAGYASYLGVSRASFILRHSEDRSTTSGFLALVAVGDRPVQVTIQSSAYTKPAREADAHGEWVDATPRDAGMLDAGLLDADDASVPQPAVEVVFPALRPGDTETLILQPGDVFQLLSAIPEDCPFEERMTDKPGYTACDPGKAYDLTGTAIQADGPVHLIGGHDCSFVPFYRYACDHLEESVFPLETWGRRVIVGSPAERVGARPYRLRVVSGADKNRITFEPAVHEPLLLSRGEWFEFETDESVLVTGSRALSVAQYLLGQGASPRVDGDPSLTLVPPIEQYRNQYNFLSPETYTSNFVMVIAPENEDVVLDGDTLKGFSPIGKTGYKIVTTKLQNAGDHELHSVSGAAVGITLYGVGAYTSYMLPGGLDLRLIPDIF